MSISHDENKIPVTPDAMAMAAFREGLKFVTVICEEPSEDEGNPQGVQFNVFVESVPRIGEGILLQDGAMCKVIRVIHKVVKHPEHGFFSMVVNVIAHRIYPKQA